MPSKTNRTGYFMIDHRAGFGTQAVPGGSMLEANTLTCSHCQKQVIVRPERQRIRAYCPKCDHYICDNCDIIRVASGGLCRTFQQVIDDYLNLVNKGQPFNPKDLING